MGQEAEYEVISGDEEGEYYFIRHIRTKVVLGRTNKQEFAHKIADALNYEQHAQEKAEERKYHKFARD